MPIFSTAVDESASSPPTVSYAVPEVSRMLSLTPARLCGVSDRKGSLEKGKDADVVVLSGDFQVQQVYARGDRCVFET